MAHPALLPATAEQGQAARKWQPSKYTQPPQPPPQDEARQREIEMATARQLQDGKALKKIRPRRTVDYGGSMGRWILLRKLRPNATYTPRIHPVIPSIIDLLPPRAYPDDYASSLCTKFIHTSTNKIRCPVNVVTWTPEGRRVLTGSHSGEFTLWNGLTFNFETILQAHDTAVRALRFAHSGAYLASADHAGVIKYFQPNMNNLTAWQGHREAVRALSFSPDDRRFATASDDSTIRLWAFEESREERVMTGHGWDVKCVEWHPTQGLLASGSKDNTIRFWDPRTGTILSTLHHHKNTVQALQWSPNGTMLASASRDATVRVFDIRALKEFRVLRGHKKEVCSLDWHPVHPLLASGGSEGAVLHWDLSGADAEPAAPAGAREQAHDSNVWSLAFHPLGHLLASASNDHTTRFWARERPGESAAERAGAPPAELDTSQQDAEDDALPGFGTDAWAPDAVPGFGAPATTAPSGFGAAPPGFGAPPPGFGGPPTNGGPPPGFGAASAPPGFGAPNGHVPSGPPGFSAGGPPDGIPGFGVPPPGFQNGPPGFRNAPYQPPPHQNGDDYVPGFDGPPQRGHMDEFGRERRGGGPGGGKPSRWGPRR